MTVGVNERTDVVLDIQGVQSRAHGERGIARYLTELALALEVAHSGSVSAYLLNPDLPVVPSIEPLTPSGRISYVDRYDTSRVGVYHVGSPFELGIPLERLWPSSARRSDVRLAVTLYDLIPYIFDEIYLSDPLVRRAYRARLELVRQADGVFAISESTARDACEYLGVRADRVVVAGAGVSDRFRRPPSREAALEAVRDAFPRVEPGYVLYTGGIEPRKNIDRLLEAYAALPAAVRGAHQLVVVCRVLPEERRELDTRLRSLSIEREVHFPGFVSDHDLVRLYQACELFVFPSMYEGFGLPVAEAIACGAATVVSRTPALVELVDDSRAHFDPKDPRSIRATLERFLTDGALLAAGRRRILDERHTWRGVAERTVTAYGALRRTARRRRRARARLACISPLPPQRTGVADVTAPLASALAAYAHVDVFVDPDFGSVDEPERVEVHSIDRFDTVERARGGYDGVLVCLGNSEHHAKSLALLRRRPAVVLAHDVRLTGLYAWSALNRPQLQPQRLHDVIREMYGARVPATVGDSGYVSADEADRYGILMAREVISLTERYLVHSTHAAQLARFDAAAADAFKIEVIPFATVDPDFFPPVSARASEPVITTFGLVAPEKHIEKTLEAFAIVAQREPTASFAVVGPISPDMRARCARWAKRLRLENRLTITGELTQPEFVAWFRRTTLAVQLRATSNGETSAAVSWCLAAGIPTIVTALGAARELPDTCVVKVERDVSPDALADEIDRLLNDRSRRAQLRDAGIAYARERSFDRVATVLAKALGIGDSARLAAPAA